MSVKQAVADELKGQTGWRVEAAMALAGEVDEKGSASAAKELRGLMAELNSSAVKPTKETGLSDFERRLAERQAKNTCIAAVSG